MSTRGVDCGVMSLLACVGALGVGVGGVGVGSAVAQQWCLDPNVPPVVDVSGFARAASLCGTADAPFLVDTLPGMQTVGGVIDPAVCEVGRGGSADGVVSASYTGPSALRVLVDLDAAVEEGSGFGTATMSFVPSVCVSSVVPAVVRVTAIHRFEQSEPNWVQAGIAGNLEVLGSCDAAAGEAPLVVGSYDTVVPGADAEPANVFEVMYTRDVFMAPPTGGADVLRVTSAAGLSGIQLPPNTARSTVGGTVEVLVEAVSLCPGDVGGPNGERDGLVNLSDFSVYLGLWGMSDAAADFTSTGAAAGTPGFGQPDGVVDLSDFSFYLALWGSSPRTCPACD